MMNRPLAPNDLEGPLRVLAFTRLPRAAAAFESSTANLARAGQWVRRRYDWPVEFHLCEDASPEVTAIDVVTQAGWLIEAGDWDVLVVDYLTRISRSAADLVEFVRHCLEHGVRVIGIDDDFDTSNSRDQ